MEVKSIAFCTPTEWARADPLSKQLDGIVATAKAERSGKLISALVGSVFSTHFAEGRTRIEEGSEEASGSPEIYSEITP